MKLALTLAACLVGSTAAYDKIAGYAPGSNVDSHNSIDLDVKAMDDDGTIAGMYTIYQYGATGSAGSPASRTLKGFSDGGDAKMKDEPYFQTFSSYYEAQQYAHDYVTAAHGGTGIFANVDDAGKKQGIMKGTVYQNVWMYAMHEFEAGIDKCVLGPTSDDNYAAVHAWDEGVAFYTGSLQGEPLAPATGKLIHVLADKRCADFHTCVDGGVKDSGSKANKRLYKLFADGKKVLEKGECHEAIAIKDEMVQVMTIPLVQGTMKYAYYSNTAADIGSDDKTLAEAHAFSRAILPLVNKCRRTDAETIAAGIDITKNTATGQSFGNFPDIKAALENNYECLGITCADVGALHKDGVIKTGAEACTDGHHDQDDDDDDESECGLSDIEIGGTMFLVLVGAFAVALFSLVAACCCWQQKATVMKQYTESKQVEMSKA